MGRHENYKDMQHALKCFRDQHKSNPKKWTPEQHERFVSLQVDFLKCARIEADYGTPGVENLDGIQRDISYHLEQACEKYAKGGFLGLFKDQEAALRTEIKKFRFYAQQQLLREDYLGAVAIAEQAYEKEQKYNNLKKDGTHEYGAKDDLSHALFERANAERGKPAMNAIMDRLEELCSTEAPISSKAKGDHFSVNARGLDSLMTLAGGPKTEAGKRFATNAAKAHQEAAAAYEQRAKECREQGWQTDANEHIQQALWEAHKAHESALEVGAPMHVDVAAQNRDKLRDDLIAHENEKNTGAVRHVLNSLNRQMNIDLHRRALDQATTHEAKVQALQELIRWDHSNTVNYMSWLAYTLVDHEAQARRNLDAIHAKDAARYAKAKALHDVAVNHAYRAMEDWHAAVEREFRNSGPYDANLRERTAASLVALAETWQSVSERQDLSTAQRQMLWADKCYQEAAIHALHAVDLYNKQGAHDTVKKRAEELEANARAACKGLKR